MFGHHKAKRENRRLKREIGRQKEQTEANNPEKLKETADQQTSQANEKAAQAKSERQKSREEGRADTEAFLAKEVAGLNPQQRQAMQYEANKSIQRSHQAANRRLLGDQASHGIIGKSGVGYAQQRDLQKLANEAQGGVERDLTKLEHDLALKKKAAIFAGGQGEAAQSQLDKQTALDELRLDEERKRQRFFEDQALKQFHRV